MAVWVAVEAEVEPEVDPWLLTAKYKENKQLRHSCAYAI